MSDKAQTIHSVDPGEIGRGLELREVDGEPDKCRVVSIDKQGERNGGVYLRGDVRLLVINVIGVNADTKAGQPEPDGEAEA